MKILLINPPRTYRPGSKGPRVGLPLGIMYIAAVLERAGHEVKIFDFLISRNTVLQKIGDSVVRHGVEDQKFIDFLRQEKPDIVGISSPFTAQLPETVRISRLVKSIYPSVLIMVGGPHFSVAGLDFLKENSQIDIAVVGEGEITTREILHSLEEGLNLKDVPGIIFRGKDNELITTKARNPISSEQLSLLPLPAYHLIDMQAYFALLEKGFAARAPRGRSVSVITSRGCPHNCIFCSIHLHMGRLWRYYSSEYVLSHIDFLVKNFQVKHISFEDDNLTMNKQRFDRILDGLIERDYGITWDTPNGVRAESLGDEELVRKMKKSGCMELIMGVESGVQRVLDEIIRKNLKLTDVVKGAKVCKKVGIPLKAFFVIGFPGESKKDIKDTIKFSLMLRRKYKVESGGAMIATPLIGTRLYKVCKENNWLIEEPTPESLSMATQSRGHGLIKTDDFTPDDLKEANNFAERGTFRIKLYETIISPSKLFAVIGRKLKRLKKQIL